MKYAIFLLKIAAFFANGSDRKGAFSVNSFFTTGLFPYRLKC